MQRSAHAERHPRWQLRLALRELFATFLKARRAVRLYPPDHTLREAGLREFTRCARRVLRLQPVRVAIAGRDLSWHGTPLFCEPPGEDLLPDLAAAGIEGLEIGQSATPDLLRALVLRCAEAPPTGAPANELHAWARAIRELPFAGSDRGVRAT